MKLRITVEGKSYDVEVEVLDDAVLRSPAETGAHASVSSPSPQPPKPLPSVAPTPSLSKVSGDRVVKAPIVGTILQLKVAPGDVVTTNQVLLVMEAMKMETNISSPLEGKVKAIFVAVGEAVKADQALVELE